MVTHHYNLYLLRNYRIAFILLIKTEVPKLKRATLLLIYGTLSLLDVVQALPRQSVCQPHNQQ
jgi:hypothetical protein